MNKDGINFKLGNEMQKVNWSTWHERGTKKTSESQADARTPGGRSINLATRTYGEQGHLTEFMCDRHPHTTRVSSVKVIMSVIKEKIWWILSSVMKCENWTDQHDTCMSEEQRKKSEFPTGIEPMTSQTPGRHSIHWATRTHGGQGQFTEFMCDRHPAYC